MIKIFKYGEISEKEIFQRLTASFDAGEVVSEIIQDVRNRGDEAVLDYCEKFDRLRPENLEVTPEEIEAAFEKTDEKLISVLKTAAKNIKAYHEKQLNSGYVVTDNHGIVLGQRVLPIEKVGIYVPGGTAAYPSTVLMNCIPAKIAGVSEILIVTPAKNGIIPPAILAAAKIAGADRIFRVGGAQAVAALAYGTESIPQVDKIVGPGNAFVAEAKRQVFGQVAIDMIAGPSEILVIADKNSSAKVVAADMLSQAEHDKNASAVLVTESEELAYAVRYELERQIPLLAREEIAKSSIDVNGKIIIVDNIDKCIDISNKIAPEHLELCVDDPFEYLSQIKNAGSVFLGRNCPEALGDYLAGPNHTLPTSGTARFSSPLSVDDFCKKYQYTYYTRDALSAVADDVAYFANTEGLGAHARSAIVRFEED